MENLSGYYRYPAISGNRIVFVSEDDLWRVPVDGGSASRLTSNLGEVSYPAFSPDGEWLAFTGKEEGHSEVYLMPSEGGSELRLTYLGANSQVIGWTPDGTHILFSSNVQQPFGRIYNLWKISSEGGQPEQLPHGLAHSISYGPDGKLVLGRNTTDPARWKRYRGGTAGTLWIDNTGNGEFVPYTGVNGNLANPMWIADRIYFLSDHEGIGNLYSINPDDQDLQQHTEHKAYYVRNASTDGKRIVYHAGAELYLYDPESQERSQIQIEWRSPGVQRNRKFVNSANFFEEYSIHPDGLALVTTHRGKSFTYPHWEGAVQQLGEPQGVRYQHTQWLHDDKHFVTVSDAGGEESLEILSTNPDEEPVRLEGLNLGRPLDLNLSPTENKVALTNHRFELILVDLDKKTSQILDRSEYERLQGFDWSPDGRWIVYGCAESQQTVSLKLCAIDSGEVHQITEPRFRDLQPSFDPQGKFIYFLSYREFNPVYDSMYFDLNFPRGMKPFLLSLQKETESPFVPKPKTPAASSTNSDATDSESSGEDGSEVIIDFDGMKNRIVQFPVPEGRYQQIKGVRGKVLFTSVPVKGSIDRNIFSGVPNADATLEYYDFDTQKKETVAKNVTSFKVSAKSETLVYRSKNSLRVMAIAKQGSNKTNRETKNRETGWIDLNRVKVSVDPVQEWHQMFREIWRLQREHFWNPEMSGVDWQRVYDRYRPLLDKVASRTEFSDLIWEMQGELGTSHAYEIGGDYRTPPTYRLGQLGADLEYVSDKEGYRITHIVQGDSWTDDSDSPLHSLGVNLKEGDFLTAIGNQKLSKRLTPAELLVNQAGLNIPLTIRKKDSGESKTVIVQTLKDDTSVRYRDWVESNRSIVYDATGGKVGYVHVPNMGPVGYAEFHRYYLAEVDKDALIVDVRFNGGGHVSQLILEKLARERIGYSTQRWGKPQPYPEESVAGPIVALTNEHAGSDGDIFSHCFKLMDIGTLIGKRTWGGVIGIWPRHHLVDGSVTTQPEFSHWFQDVGWGVENYGTDPNIEVDIAPQDYAAGRDPQLNKAIAVVREQLEKSPVQMPEIKSKPDLSLPE